MQTRRHSGCGIILQRASDLKFELASSGMSIIITYEGSRDEDGRIRVLKYCVLKGWGHKCPLNESVVREQVRD